MCRTKSKAVTVQSKQKSRQGHIIHTTDTANHFLPAAQFLGFAGSVSHSSSSVLGAFSLCFVGTTIDSTSPFIGSVAVTLANVDTSGDRSTLKLSTSALVDDVEFLLPLLWTWPFSSSLAIVHYPCCGSNTEWRGSIRRVKKQRNDKDFRHHALR